MDKYSVLSDFRSYNLMILMFGDYRWMMLEVVVTRTTATSAVGAERRRTPTMMASDPSLAPLVASLAANNQVSGHSHGHQCGSIALWVTLVGTHSGAASSTGYCEIFCDT